MEYLKLKQAKLQFKLYLHAKTVFERMYKHETCILLIDLPTFPKGTISLSLLTVASHIKALGTVEIFDLNIQTEQALLHQIQAKKYAIIGMKVSAQNYFIAKNLTHAIKQLPQKSKIIWGGEYPTLMPEECLQNADTIVTGLFHSIAPQLIADFKKDTLQRRYTGNNQGVSIDNDAINFNLLGNINRYNKFMGLPLETTRGCTEVCTFCMVHTMQAKHYHTKPIENIQAEVKAIGNNFINIIDYNFGVNKSHVIEVCKIIETSNAIGFMAEMCIELLDDEEILTALAAARCKMIYCGLETIDETALKSIHKMNTNHIENYTRIIEKVQRYGIQIASGFILGMAGTTNATFKKSLNFFEYLGIMYVKLTFLTYNPGTRAHTYYKKKGSYIAKEPMHYDGNHLSYLPDSVSEETIHAGTDYFVDKFYSLSGLIRRAFKTNGNFKAKMAFVLFNYCYSRPYKLWIKHQLFSNDEAFKKALMQPYQKSTILRMAESLLLYIWKQAK